MSDGMRRELAYLSSHATNRYFIPNWGNYMSGETEEARSLYGTFQKGKHELFPIPSKEIELSGIEQNPNW